MVAFLTMKIAIIGAGTIGANLAEHLSAEKHEVYLVEPDKEVASKANEKLDVKVIIGEGSDPDVLQEAHISEAGLVIAVTSSDETNLVVCSLANAYGAGKKIARVRAATLNKAIQKFGYDHFAVDEIINPEQIAAESIVKIIEAPGTCEVADFANSRILLRSFDIAKDSPLWNIELHNPKLRNFAWPFLIVAMRHDGSLIFPRGDTVIHEGDRIYVLLPAASHDEFLAFVNPNIGKAKKVIIYGATNIGKSVAAALSGLVKEVIVLEGDAAKAQQVAEQIESIKVINGSALEADILNESGIEGTDVFIGVSSSDHFNLVSAVLAKKMGARKTIITTQLPGYHGIVDAMGIDVVINPRVLATYQILRLVRGASIRHIAKLIDCGAQVLELIPEKGSPVTRAPIRDIKFPKNSIAGAITRGSEAFLVDGSIQINAGEPVIVFCQDEEVLRLQKLFTRKTIF